MKWQSPARRTRRRVLANEGSTFTDRVREALRTGKKIKEIRWTEESKKAGIQIPKEV